MMPQLKNEFAPLGEIMRMPARAGDAVQNAQRHVRVRFAQVDAAAILANERSSARAPDRAARARRQPRELVLAQQALVRLVASGAAVGTLIELGWGLSRGHRDPMK